MDELAKGIVLRFQPYSESSLIIRWLTETQGRVDTMAKGARRPKSPLRGKLDLFYLAEFTFARSRHTELHSLRELRLLNTFAALRSNLTSLRQASYASALLTQTTECGLPLPEIFNLFFTFVQYLAAHQPHPILLLAFELRLLAALGLQPDFSQLRLSPEGRETAEACLVMDWQDLGNRASTRIKELEAALQRFLEFNFGRTLAQRAAALMAE